MATPFQKLADSLEVLHGLQARGMIAIRSADLSRTHRERLLKNGFIREVIKGWYIPTRPDEIAGDSTAWYASFWQFCAAYLNQIKGSDWCLSPEQSIALHAENWMVPKQLLVRAIKARNNITPLPFNTSLLEIRAALPEGQDITEIDGIRLYSLSAALIACAPGAFKQNSTDMRATLSIIRDASPILEKLLAGGHSSIAGRIAGAFRNIGRDQLADTILNTMRAAGYEVREHDPFETEFPKILSSREQSPYVNRIKLMWQEMRGQILELFPDPPGFPSNIEAYMQHVDDVYVTDAYHSLSIEGYRVSRELIKRVREGGWDPEKNSQDKENLNALAARGYWQAYIVVRDSLERILKGENSGDVVARDHSTWYVEMFAPGVTAGIHKPVDLAGYRNGPVFIRRSMHVPPSREAVGDAMPALFDLLRDETSAAVRTVLGHFFFVYIHPYMDGNGRMGRFLMNAMLASGGYPWAIVPVEMRSEYMAALEDASTKQNILPFARFIASLVKKELTQSDT